MKTHSSPTAVFARSLLTCALGAAFAQGTLAQERSGILEEIVVTAEHREASLQETQISITAFSGETLTDLGISSGLDLSQYVPNLTAQPFVGGRTGVGFNIRGVGDFETLITFDPAVSVYLDNVLIAKNTGALLDVLELERIEVLRGPQGTLYGRNTMGGAVNYITKNPSNEFEGSLNLSVGNYGRRDIRGMLNVPLLGADSPIGELNLRVNAASLNRDGIQTNRYEPVGQSELGTVDRDVARIHLLWRPVDNVDIKYSYDRTRIDEIPQTVWVTGTNVIGAGPFVAPYTEKESRRPRGGYFNAEHRGVTDVDGHSLTAAWHINDNLTLHAITGYREMENYSKSDSDGTPLALLATEDLQSYDSLSQEFRAVGTALDERLDYSMGIYYMREEGDAFNNTIASGNSGINVATYKNEALAVYGQATYTLAERWKLTAGVRYTEEDREMSKARLSAPYLPPMSLSAIRRDPVLSAGVFPDADKSFSQMSPMASLSYNWSDDIMTYVKVSSGYQSGGFNIRDVSPIDFVEGFDEETLVAYELGLKSTLADRYQLNAALWFSDYEDKRVNNFNPETLGNVVRNAGEVEIWGVELEFLAQLTDNLYGGVNYGHTDPKYVKYDDGRGNDLSNRSNFPQTPRNSAHAFLGYEQPVSMGVFKARLDWTYRDTIRFLVAQPELNSSGSLQLLNARVSLDDIAGYGNSRMRLSAWVKNITNEGYWDFGINLYNSFGFNVNTYGEPRTFGVDVEFKF